MLHNTLTSLISTIPNRISVLTLLLSCMALPSTADEEEHWFMTGFNGYPLADAPKKYNAGFSMYVAIWPLLETYPGSSFQSGLISTWMSPVEREGVFPSDSFNNTIEGGLGWWTGTRFATTTPKFIVGAVANDFSAWSNGPGAGGGGDPDTWGTSRGEYGVAQLSNRLLFPLDGLVISPDSLGGYFGYGYTPLPLIDGGVRESGYRHKVGGNSWTLFLDTENFRGATAFIMPDFFASPAFDDPRFEGWFLDSLLADPTSLTSLGLENHEIPAHVRFGQDDIAYAKLSTTQFPANGEGRSHLFADVNIYNQGALANRVKDWFAGGTVANPQFNAAGSYPLPPWPDAYHEMMIIPEGSPYGADILISMDEFLSTEVIDGQFTYRWTSDLVREADGVYQIPSYYRRDRDSDDNWVWIAISAADVPKETGLIESRFIPEPPYFDEPLVAPTAAESPWQTPGPIAGPFEVDLIDGSTVTYAWYRFVDQPAVQYWGIPLEQLEGLQSRVEMIHREWRSKQSPFQTEMDRPLARLDPHQIVEPPEGFEIGYVPIAIKQEKTDG